MLNQDDLLKMQADLAALISDNSVTISIDRAGVANPLPQTVRVERLGSMGRRITQQSTEESRASVVVVGDTTLDIQKDDTFVIAGKLYRVTFIRPNAQAGIQVEAEEVQ